MTLSHPTSAPGSSAHPATFFRSDAPLTTPQTPSLPPFPVLPRVPSLTSEAPKHQPRLTAARGVSRYRRQERRRWAPVTAHMQRDSSTPPRHPPPAPQAAGRPIAATGKDPSRVVSAAGEAQGEGRLVKSCQSQSVLTFGWVNSNGA